MQETPLIPKEEYDKGNNAMQITSDAVNEGEMRIYGY